MGRASSNKKVARAAKAAGQPGTSKSLVWPVSIGVVVLLGIGLIVASAAGRDGSASAGPILGDHWHSAYGIDICGEWLPPLADQAQDTTGLHTHRDGLIHIHPASTSYTRDDATLNAWGEAVGLELDDGTLALPDRELTEGDDCGGEPGEVQVMVWDGPGADEGRLIESPGDYVLADGEVITIAFRPEGAELEQPPTVARLQDPTAPEEGRPLVPIDGVPDPGEDGGTEGDTTDTSTEDGTTDTSADETTEDTSETTATSEP